MLRREQKHELLLRFEIALRQAAIQRIRKNKKNFLVATTRNIYKAAGATLHASAVILFCFSLVVLACGCEQDNIKGSVVYSINQERGLTCVYHLEEDIYFGKLTHITDSVGKYKIGDTLYFSKNK